MMISKLSIVKYCWFDIIINSNQKIYYLQIKCQNDINFGVMIEWIQQNSLKSEKYSFLTCEIICLLHSFKQCKKLTACFTSLTKFVKHIQFFSSSFSFCYHYYYYFNKKNNSLWLKFGGFIDTVGLVHKVIRKHIFPTTSMLLQQTENRVV